MTINAFGLSRESYTIMLLCRRSEFGVTGLTASEDDISGPLVELTLLILVATVGGYPLSSKPALLCVLMLRLRFEGDDGSSLISPYFSLLSSFCLLFRKKNQTRAAMRATPSTEATTAAAMRPPDMPPESFCCVGRFPGAMVPVTVGVC